MGVKNKICLVTGAAGFIGSNLVDRLLKEGAAKVIGIDNFVSGRYENIQHLDNNKRFHFVRTDVRDSEAIKPYVLASNFVFSLAASKLVVSLKHPRTDLETNIVGIFNILEILREFGEKKDIRMVHISTGSTLGNADRPMPEDWPPNPTTLYGISKLAGEKYCMFYAREFGIKVSVIRYFHVFGPRQDYMGPAGVINIFLSRVLKGQSPVVDGKGEQIRCFTFVEDDVDATLLVALKDEAIGQIYNVASPTRLSIKELAEMIIRKYAKGDLKIVFGPSRQGDNMKPVPDTAKIEKLGFKAKYSFEEGLEKTKQWIQEDIKRTQS